MSALARTCSVPVARMEALAGELRLFKAQISVMQGRCDLVLAEIAEELEQAGTDAEPIEDPRPVQDNWPGATLTLPLRNPQVSQKEPRAPADVEANCDRTHVAASGPSELEADTSGEPGGGLEFTDDIVATPPVAASVAVDAAASAQGDAPTETVDPHEVEDGPVAESVVPVLADFAPAEKPEAEIPPEAPAVLPDPAPELARLVATHAVRSHLPPNVVVLGALQPQAKHKTRSAIIKAAPWLAATALTIAAAVAAGSSGIAARATHPSNVSFGLTDQGVTSPMQDIWRARASSAFH